MDVEGTLTLIEDMISLGIKPVFLSSSFVYDGEKGGYGEDHPHNPISAYGRHKSQVEKYVSGMAGDALVLRFDKIVGDDPSEHHLFSEWHQWITGKRPITCIQGQVISPTWVKNAAQAIVLGCTLGLSGLYNVANQEFIARDQLAEQFTAALGIDHQIVSKPQVELNLLDRRPLK